MLGLLLLGLFVHFGGSNVPKVLKDNKQMVYGVTIGLVLCSFFGVNVEGFSMWAYEKGENVKYYPGVERGTRKFNQACQGSGGRGGDDDCKNGLFCRYPIYGDPRDTWGKCVTNVPEPNDVCPSFTTDSDGVVTCGDSSSSTAL